MYTRLAPVSGRHGVRLAERDSKPLYNPLDDSSLRAERSIRFPDMARFYGAVAQKAVHTPHRPPLPPRGVVRHDAGSNPACSARAFRFGMFPIHLGTILHTRGVLQNGAGEMKGARKRD